MGSPPQDNLNETSLKCDLPRTRQVGGGKGGRAIAVRGIFHTCSAGRESRVPVFLDMATDCLGIGQGAVDQAFKIEFHHRYESAHQFVPAS
jgi:hypothetical protein